MELFPELFSSKSLNTPMCSYLAVKLFFSLFTPLGTVVSSGKEALRQICKTNYKSTIVITQLIKQLGMAGSDLLGETVLNFTYSI